MKPILLIILLLLPATTGWAQQQPDKIVYHQGEIAPVIVTGVTERTVTFNYPGEKVQITQSLNAIAQINFASGRIQNGSQKVTVNSSRDWEKVIITDVESDVVGLIKKGELYEKSTATTVFSGSQKIDAKATKKIKMAAAGLGAHVVYLQGLTNDKGLRRVNRSIKSGIAYGYK